MQLINQKNILIVSYYFPPTKTVATVRIFNFHREAQKHFKAVHALTTSNRKRFPQDDFDFDDSKTTEIPTIDLRRFLTKKNATASLSHQAKQSRFAKFLSKLSVSFPFNILIGDGGLIYILCGFFKGKKIIRNEKIEFIFSSYRPYADHLICFLLKKWNPRLFWIADFRDLHVDEIRKNVLFPKIQKWFNRRILKRADIVTTVSKGLENNLKQYTSKTYVLRNGISSTSSSPVAVKHFEKFTISYTGSIYPEFQKAELFFNALKKLISERKIDKDKIQIVYAGKEGGVWEKWVSDFSLKKINTTHGFLSIKKAQEIQRKSHINLLLSWSNENLQGILTAKFYDYLLARNPILLIINGKKDEEFEQIFKELKAGLVSYQEGDFEKNVEDFLLGKYEKWGEKGSLETSFQEEKLKEFKWDYQMEKFINKLS